MPSCGCKVSGVKCTLEHMLTASRSSVACLLKELDPRGSSARKRNLNRKRGEFVVLGPDYVWLLDDHDKLADWGIEIYAAIVTYSRKII